MKEQIINWVMTGIASVGGISGVIAIICTIIKTLGGNGLKTKLASLQVDTDKSIRLGLDEIANRINTEITIDVSSKVDKAITSELSEQKELNANLLEEIKVLRQAQAESLRVLSDMRTISSEQRHKLLEMADKVGDVKEIEHEIKPKAHITLQPIEKVEENTESVYKVVI